MSFSYSPTTRHLEEIMLCQSTFCSNNEPVEKEEKDKKRGRKPRKMNEKEIIQEYLQDSVLVNNSFENSQKDGKRPTVDDTNTKTVLKREQKTVKKNGQHHPVLQSKERIPETALTTPRTPTQEIYVENLKNNTRRIIIATGPAGTGKTVFACEYGLHLFFKGQFDKIIFTRPLVSVDEEFGFLPGTMEEKMAPWVRPIYDVLVQYIPAKEIQLLMDEKTIEIIPLGFMRGRTFKRTWIVADEMQNSTANQMKMLLTRIGQGSKMILTGDLQQCDHTTKHHYKYGGNRVEPILNGLEDFLKRFYLKHLPVEERNSNQDNTNSNIVHYEFGTIDIQREQVVKDVLNIYGGNA